MSRRSMSTSNSLDVLTHPIRLLHAVTLGKARPSTNAHLAAARQLRVFLASPGDVVIERRIVRDVVQKIERGRRFRGLVAIQLFSWDDSEGGVPMLASLSPQESVSRGMPRPSECDLVIGVIWGRMGTPLSSPRKSDGSRYLSGTESEIEDGLRAHRPVLLYRCIAPIPTTIDDPELDEKRRQKMLVDQYFESFRNADGSIRTSYRTYDTSEVFATRLRADLEHLIADIIHLIPATPQPVAVLPTWLWFVLIPLLIEGLGLSIEYTFNRSLGRIASFGWATPAEWFWLGLRSLLSPVAWLATVVGTLSGLMFIARRLAPSRFVNLVGGGIHRVVTSVSRVLSLDNPIVMSQALTIVGGAAAVIAVSRFWPLILAFSGLNSDTPTEQLLALSPQNAAEHAAYRTTFTALSALLALGFNHAHRARVQAMMIVGLGWERLALCVIVLAIALGQAPYKVLNNSEFEVVEHTGNRCYVVSANRRDVLLYCPTDPPPHRRVVARNDSQLRRIGLIAPIFGDIPARLEETR